MLSIRCLGPLEIRLGDETPTFETRKERALLVFLACHPGQALGREHLQALLWSEAAPEKAARSLRQALVTLRRSLPEDCLHITREAICFNPNTPYTLDAASFETKSPDLALYRGSFLEGFDLPDAPAWEEWLSAKREALQVRALTAFDDAGANCAARGLYTEAIGYYHRALAVEPWRETTHQLLMRLHAINGDPAATLAQYEKCQRALAEGLGVAPSSQTRALHDRIRDAASIAHRPLPAQPTPFVGREAELALIADRLNDPQCRLLSLIGPGGSGKTRLALRAAEQTRSFLHGVYFVPLAYLTSPAGLPIALAEAFRLSLYGRENPKEQVINYLREKELLLVFDNFEHLLPEAGTLSEILEAAPAVKMLVTSRARLDLLWEWPCEVGGLDYPADGNYNGFEAFGAVQLFVQSARRLRPEFALNETDKRSITCICQQMSGMPLGLELAAALTRSHTCAEVVALVERDADSLVTPLRDVPERHRSLRAVFNHSWQLLTLEEQGSFKRLSIFRGAFSAEAAERVSGASRAVLAALADKSLLRHAPDGYYEMHRLLHQYAREKLEAEPEALAETQVGHCRFYLDWLAGLQAALMGPDQLTLLDTVGRQFENVRAAWEAAASQSDWDDLDAAAHSLFLFIYYRGRVLEGVNLFKLVLTLRPDLPTALAGKLQARAGYLSYWLSEYEASLGFLNGAMAAAQASEASGAEDALAFALMGLAEVKLDMGDFDDCARLWHEALALFREVGDAWGVVACLASLGLFTHFIGQYADSKAYFDESERLSRANNLPDNLADAWIGLGLVAIAEGSGSKGESYLEDALARKRALGQMFGVGLCLNALAFNACLQQKYLTAREYLEDSLSLHREHSLRSGAAWAVQLSGDLAHATGDFDQAAQFYSECMSVRQEIGDVYGMILTLNRIGFNTLKQGNPAEAEKQFGQAIQLASAFLPPLTLDALCGIAACTLTTNPQQASDFLALILAHPAAHAETRLRARQLIRQSYPATHSTLTLEDAVQAALSILPAS